MVKPTPSCRNICELKNDHTIPPSPTSFTRTQSSVSQKCTDFGKHLALKPFSPGGHSGHTHTGGGQSQKFSGNPKISLQLQCNPKISAHVIYINLYMNIEYPQTMQIEVRIASIEHRNIDITMFGIKKYHQHSFSFFGPKNITFGNILTQKYRTYLPVCACAEPRGGGLGSSR